MNGRTIETGRAVADVTVEVTGKFRFGGPPNFALATCWASCRFTHGLVVYGLKALMACRFAASNNFFDDLRSGFLVRSGSKDHVLTGAE